MPIRSHLKQHSGRYVYSIVRRHGSGRASQGIQGRGVHEEDGRSIYPTQHGQAKGNGLRGP